MSGYWSKSLCSKWGWFTFSANFSGNGKLPANDCWRQKTRFPGLSRGIGGVLLLPPSAPERSRLVSSRSFSTSERFASRSLTPGETSPSALTLLRPKRATKRIATPTCLLFCAGMENSDEMYVFAVFCTYLVTFMKIVSDNSLSC